MRSLNISLGCSGFMASFKRWGLCSVLLVFVDLPAPSLLTDCGIGPLLRGYSQQCAALCALQEYDKMLSLMWNTSIFSKKIAPLPKKTWCWTLVKVSKLSLLYNVFVKYLFQSVLSVLLLISYVGNRFWISKINIFVFVMGCSSKMLSIYDTENITFALSFSCIRRQLSSLGLSTYSHCTVIPGKGLVENECVSVCLMLSVLKWMQAYSSKS